MRLEHRVRGPVLALLLGEAPGGFTCSWRWATGEDTAGEHRETDMTTATELGQTGLQGWRQKVADGISGPVAKRAPVEEDQVRAALGAAFFALAVIYVVKTISAAARQAR
jgi:hypothetical protein